MMTQSLSGIEPVKIDCREDVSFGLSGRMPMEGASASTPDLSVTERFQFAMGGGADRGKPFDISGISRMDVGDVSKIGEAAVVKVNGDIAVKSGGVNAVEVDESDVTESDGSGVAKVNSANAVEMDGVNTAKVDRVYTLRAIVPDPIKADVRNMPGIGAADVSETPLPDSPKISDKPVVILNERNLSGRHLPGKTIEHALPVKTIAKTVASDRTAISHAAATRLEQRAAAEFAIVSIDENVDSGKVQIITPAPLPIELPFASVRQPAVAFSGKIDCARMLIAAADAVADAIIVSSEFKNGEGCILVRLQAEVLGGSEVQITAKGGMLTIAVNPVSQDVQTVVEVNKTQFEQYLAEKIHSWRITVAVKRGDRIDERV